MLIVFGNPHFGNQTVREKNHRRVWWFRKMVTPGVQKLQEDNKGENPLGNGRMINAFC